MGAPRTTATGKEESEMEYALKHKKAWPMCSGTFTKLKFPKA